MAEMLGTYFRLLGFEVASVNRGEAVLHSCGQFPPDLILLDTSLPGLPCHKLAVALRSNSRSSGIPILFITDKPRQKWLEMKGWDHVIKPFDIQELHMRIRQLLADRQPASKNTLSGLPEGTWVEQRLEEYRVKPAWGMLIISLLNLDVFREACGEAASDEVLRLFGSLVRVTCREGDGVLDVIGHLSPTALVIIIDPGRAGWLKESLSTRITEALRFISPTGDRQQASSGNVLISCKVGCLQSTDGPFSSLEDLKSRL